MYTEFTINLLFFSVSISEALILRFLYRYKFHLTAYRSAYTRAERKTVRERWMYRRIILILARERHTSSPSQRVSRREYSFQRQFHVTLQCSDRPGPGPLELFPAKTK